MADTIRRSTGVPSVGRPVVKPTQDRTEAEQPAATLPPVKPMPPMPSQAVLVPVATTTAGDILLPASTSKPIPITDDDYTKIPPVATQLVRAVNQPSPTMRSDSVPAAVPASLVAEAERPKVWVATHKAPADPDPRLILLREPDSLRAASFRVMRHRLAERGDPRVIAVSSAGPRDGKTTVAANLALALSEFGRAKVLLLEANFRAPQIAVLFGFLPPECFSVQLARHRDRPLDPWSIVEAFSSSLHVLAVKPGETNRPLLDAPAFAISLEMLRRVGYDYMIVDTPPVLGSADVNLIEDYVDAVVLTARAGRTKGRELRAAVEQLTPRKLFGVTLLDA
ncbi:MAG: CpsD/CapB family tyrosine-protein kinase [Polyangia bacterium]